MKLIKHIKILQEHVLVYKELGRTIGFIPTMGALHAGHVSLIERSVKENDVTICSIFVNPTQFNNPDDLKKYPITIEADIDLLEKAGCNILFLPSVDEMYLADEQPSHYNLGNLENLLEGKYRPGHFQGVCIIVDKLLAAVIPHVLYLGKKDFQQCMVIHKMMQEKKYDILLQICDTIREADGLAMSSRNMRLNVVEREKALCIIKSLQMIKEGIEPGNITNLKIAASNFLLNNGYKVDYTEIADAETLELQNHWDGKRKLVALVAAYLNEVRLIDNIDI
jgi:pantoate--beta-alanine ligase